MSEPERVIPLPTPRDMERDAVNDYNTPFRVEECGAITSWLRRAVFAEAAAAKLAEACSMSLGIGCSSYQCPHSRYEVDDGPERLCKWHGAAVAALAEWSRVEGRGA